MPSRARTLTGAALPHRLSDLRDPPECLYLRGELPGGPAVAVVGTRRPTPPAVRFTEGLAAALAEAGVAVLSGGAEGIDSAAHRGALAAGGRTVVVAPAGFRRPFPAFNRELFAAVVARGGAYLSVAPDRSAASRATFFARNACLVALAHAVVVVQAPLRSGARNAARWARAHGRPLFVVPSAPWIPQGRGCVVEIKRGARVCEGPEDVLAELERQQLHPLPAREPPDGGSPATRQGLLPFGKAEPARSRAALGELAKRVLDALERGAAHIDQVCEETGLSVAVVQRQILTLTLQGVLAPAPPGGCPGVDNPRSPRKAHA